jgi:hypothetical protein
LTRISSSKTARLPGKTNIVQLAAAMCIYYTFHFACCPGTAVSAPYYLHERCPISYDQCTPGVPKRLLKKCKVEHEVLEGADYDQTCPRCG